MGIPAHHAAILGAVQGLTEFLPISSDGHLALTEALLGITADNLALSVTLHLGTLLATLVYFRAAVKRLLLQVGPLLRALVSDRRALAHLDLGLVLIASLPTAVIGLLLRDAVEAWTRSPTAVALGFFGTAAALSSTARVRPGKRDNPSLKNAFWIGVAQGLAVVPGLSRSGSTIAVALHSGVKPERAFELSMLISMPAVAGAIALELPQALHGDESLGVLSLGVVVAFVVGLFALRWLRHWVVRGRFALFALWVIPMAMLTLATASSWPK
jgi:undecaprenyl-diphosphatase